MTTFDEAIAVTLDGSTATAHTHPAYANMVGPFGGATAATVINAVLAHPEVHGRPAALTLNFTAPLHDGEYTLELKCAKKNRSNQHWVITGHQDGDVPLTATVVTAIDREGLDDVVAQPLQVPAPDQVEVADVRNIRGFAQNYEFRFVEGGRDALGRGPNRNTTTTLWVREADPRPWDYQSITAVSDIFYPRSFLRAGTPIPAGTITLTTYFHASAADIAELGEYVLGTAYASTFGNQLHDQQSQLWSEDGKLLVTSSQLVYFKAPVPDVEEPSA